MSEISRSKHIYTIYAKRNTSQFGQKLQEIRCRILDARTNYGLVESLKRYNKKYAGAAKTQSGLYKGMPVRRIDTHVAVVFLAGDRAFKVKRAVRFPFVDFSTLEKRKAACEAWAAAGSPRP